MRCVANANRLDESIAQLVNDEKSLQRFAFLRGLAPTMRATEFAQRATSAYSRWPKEMLEQQLNHDALASSVQHALFEENPYCWKAFVTDIQKKVTWFGTGLTETKSDVTPKANQATPEKLIRSRNRWRQRRPNGAHRTKSGVGPSLSRVRPLKPRSSTATDFSLEACSIEAP